MVGVDRRLVYERQPVDADLARALDRVIHVGQGRAAGALVDPVGGDVGHRDGAATGQADVAADPEVGEGAGGHERNSALVGDRALERGHRAVGGRDRAAGADGQAAQRTIAAVHDPAAARREGAPGDRAAAQVHNGTGARGEDGAARIGGGGREIERAARGGLERPGVRRTGGVDRQRFRLVGVDRRLVDQRQPVDADLARALDRVIHVGQGRAAGALVDPVGGDVGHRDGAATGQADVAADPEVGEGTGGHERNSALVGDRALERGDRAVGGRDRAAGADGHAAQSAIAAVHDPAAARRERAAR